MSPQWQNIAQGYKSLGRDPGPWVTQQNNAQNAQMMQTVANNPRFQLAMQHAQQQSQSPTTPAPILSKDSQQLQGPGGPLTDEELQQQAVQQMVHTPRFQQIMKRGPILAKDSPRLMPDDNDAPKDQEVSYMDPLYGHIGIVGMSAVGNFLDKRAEREAYRKSKIKNLPDWYEKPVLGSQGDYVINSGVFRPKDYVPVQFRSYPRGPQMMAAEGGTMGDAGMSGVDDDVVPGYYDSEIREAPEISTVDLLDVHSDPGKGKGKEKNPTQEAGWIPTPKTDVEPTKNAWKAFEYYISEGLPAHIAAGIVGNLHRESGVNPRQQQHNGGPGRGIAQWTDALALPEKSRANAGDRWNDFLKWAAKEKKNPYRLETQLKYVQLEPGWGPETFAKLYKTDSPEQAALVFGRNYEKPREEEAAWEERAGIARKLYDEYMRRTGHPVHSRVPDLKNDFNITSLEPDNNSDVAMMDEPLSDTYVPDREEGVGIFERGGEYLVTPKQLKFILANGGEIEFL